MPNPTITVYALVSPDGERFFIGRTRRPDSLAYKLAHGRHDARAWPAAVRARIDAIRLAGGAVAFVPVVVGSVSSTARAIRRASRSARPPAPATTRRRPQAPPPPPAQRRRHPRTERQTQCAAAAERAERAERDRQLAQVGVIWRDEISGT